MKFISNLKHWANQISSFLKNSWSRLTQKLKSVLPIYNYEIQLNSLLAARNEAKNLYEQISNGKSSKRLVDNFEWMLRAENVSINNQGQAYLLLSKLYSEELYTKNFVILPDVQKAQLYYKKAAEILNNNTVLSETAKHYLNCIRKGGEPYVAYEILTSKAQDTQNKPSFTWSNKVLSYLYRSGVTNNDFVIHPNRMLSEKYAKLALPGITEFQFKIKNIAKKLTHSWFRNSRAYQLVQKIANCSEPYAQYKYAKYLEQQKRNANEFLPYYQQAADGCPESALTFKTKGCFQAQFYLLYAAERKQHGIVVDEEKFNKYCFQIMKESKKNYAADLMMVARDKAKKGNVIANLQMGCITLQNAKLYTDILQAEKYFDCADKSKPTTSYQLELYEKLSLKLADYYEELFLDNPTSLTFKLDANAKNYLEKAIYYLQKISSNSKKYEEVLYRVGHYQHYFLKDDVNAFEVFRKMGDLGSVDGAYFAIFIGFKKYWEERKLLLSKSDQEKINYYEKQKTPYFEGITHIKHFPVPNAQHPNLANSKMLFEKILTSFNLFCENKSQKDNDEKSRYNDQILKNMQSMLVCFEGQKLKKAENARAESELQKVLTDFFQKNTKVVSSQFLNCSEKKKDLTTINSVLQALLQMMPEYERLEGEEEAIKEHYYSILKQSYFEFVMRVCRLQLQGNDKIFEFNNEQQNLIRGMVYAK